jgi:hypothetical protein
MMRQSVKIFQLLDVRINRGELKVARVGICPAFSFHEIAAFQQPTVFLANLQHLPADPEQRFMIQQISEKKVSILLQTLAQNFGLMQKIL